MLQAAISDLFLLHWVYKFGGEGGTTKPNNGSPDLLLSLVVRLVV